jgi:hypothetical protein
MILNQAFKVQFSDRTLWKPAARLNPQKLPAFIAKASEDTASLCAPKTAASSSLPYSTA